MIEGPVAGTEKNRNLTGPQPEMTGLSVAVGPLQKHQPVAVGPLKPLTQTGRNRLQPVTTARTYCTMKVGYHSKDLCNLPIINNKL